MCMVKYLCCMFAMFCIKKLLLLHAYVGITSHDSLHQVPRTGILQLNVTGDKMASLASRLTTRLLFTSFCRVFMYFAVCISHKTV